MLVQHDFSRPASTRPVKLIGIATLLLAISLFYSVQQASGQEATSRVASVEQLTAMLQAIDPYRPTEITKETIEVFGSSSMDALAHGWATGFKQFHPQAKLQISAVGSEELQTTMLAKPTGVAMVSRPVTSSELDELKKKGLKNPVAFMVAREALSVFVHVSNPVATISGEQLRDVFTTGAHSGQLKWSSLGASGQWAEQPVHVITRTETSGTQRFLADFVFNAAKMREGQSKHVSNAEVLQALSNDPLAIAICGFRSSGTAVKALQLTSGATIIPCDDHAVLSGQYPLTRPMSLVIDMGQTGSKATASQELVRYALCQSGQTQAILVGLFPVDLPLLRAGMETLSAATVR
jgi:phosphate transport system substrate-binding protein